MTFLPVMGSWIVMKKGANQIELPMPISHSAGKHKVIVSPAI